MKTQIKYANLYILLLVSIFFMSFCSANLPSLGEFAQNEEIRIAQTCSDATYINISSISYPNSSTAVSNIEMTSSGSGEFYYLFNLTDKLGRYDVRGVSDGCEKTFATYFTITPSGRVVSDSKMTANIVLFVFFLIIILTFYFLNRRIDYEKWYDSIIRKYEHKNHIKVILSSIGYNLMKNAFIWYYLFCFPLLLLVTDISYTFGVESMIEFLKIVLAIYYYGFILVGIFLFGYLQEWIAKLVDDIKSWDMGVNE